METETVLLAQVMRRPGEKYAVRMPLWLVLLILATVHIIYFRFYVGDRPAVHVSEQPDIPQPASRIPRSWDSDG